MINQLTKELPHDQTYTQLVKLVLDFGKVLVILMNEVQIKSISTSNWTLQIESGLVN